MNIYLVSQSISNGYDTYDSMVVAAESEEDARTIHPSDFVTHVSGDKWMGTYYHSGEEYAIGRDEWPEYSQREEFDVSLIGAADIDVERGPICTSYNAG